MDVSPAHKDKFTWIWITASSRTFTQQRRLATRQASVPFRKKGRYTHPRATPGLQLLRPSCSSYRTPFVVQYVEACRKLICALESHTSYTQAQSLQFPSEPLPSEVVSSRAFSTLESARCIGGVPAIGAGTAWAVRAISSGVPPMLLRHGEGLSARFSLAPTIDACSASRSPTQPSARPWRARIGWRLGLSGERAASTRCVASEECGDRVGWPEGDAMLQRWRAVLS